MVGDAHNSAYILQEWQELDVCSSTLEKAEGMGVHVSPSDSDSVLASLFFLGYV